MIVVPVKKRMRVVPLEAISRYLRCDVSKLLTCLDHLINQFPRCKGTRE